MEHIRSVKGPLVAALFAVLAVLFAATVGVVTEHDGSPASVVVPAASSSTTSSTSTTVPPTTTIAPAVSPSTDPPPSTPQPDPEPTVEAPTPPSAGGAGHSDAWWSGVAQCEQGGRNDPFFGYFSFMDGSQGGRPWADQVAAGNALLAGQASESPAWAPACVAAGYAASPGG